MNENFFLSSAFLKKQPSLNSVMSSTKYNFMMCLLKFL